MGGEGNGGVADFGLMRQGAVSRSSGHDWGGGGGGSAGRGKKRSGPILLSRPKSDG